MGEWGNADGEIEASPASAVPPTAPDPITAAIAGVDVDVALRDAVQGAWRRRLDAVAATAIDQLLDEATLAQLRTAADDAAHAALAAPAEALEADEPPELYYPTLPVFVAELLLPMYRRPLGGGGVTWCPEWWRHAEAIARLEALWRAWEHLRLDPATGMSVWFRDHADHHMAVLLNADGPFKGCSKDKGHGERLPALPLTAPPEGLF
jgi:hypothetical protein